LAADRYDAGLAALTRSPPPSAALETARAHLARARRAEAENRTAAARHEYEAALPGILMGRYLVYVSLARLAQVDGDEPAAIEAFRHAVQLAPHNRNIRLELAAVYAAESRFDDALAELVAGLAARPRDGRLHAAVGQLFLNTDRPADAADAFRRALALEPDRYEPRYGLATALTRLGKNTDAARELERFEAEQREAEARRRRAMADQSQRDQATRPGAQP
jgi:tetratricopeptide (TPR) repeat protein